MAVEIRLPQLAEGMTSAKVAVWLKKEGDKVKNGEAVAEVETDKTNVELESPSAGVLQKIHVQAGTNAAVGDLLAVIGEAAGKSSGEEARGNGAAAAVASAPPPAQPPVATTQAKHAESHEPARPLSIDPSANATPLAGRMAALAGLDLSTLRTSGGRVTKADVDRALKGSAPAPAPARAFEDARLSPMRRVTAERLQHAKQTIPHFYLQVDCKVDDLLGARAQLNARQSDVKITINDFIVLAVSRALRKVPAANSGWIDDGVRVFESVDIAVAVNTPKGLITPIVRDVQSKTLIVVSRELKDLVERARQGKLKPDEYQGGTFTISNLGMSGVSQITPIINPPQSCILGVGAVEERPIVKDGQVTAGQVMNCTLAADHRAIDGATGAELLAEVRRLLEQPASLLLLS
jgi:pyruvate dehydrogenase E2 component (dihydrolipoamide acetyltransferase)